MLEPTLALQTAIRSALLASSAVMAIVPDPANIRASGSRPEQTPCVIMSDGQTELHGQDYTAQRAAWVYLNLHCWTLSAGEDAVKQLSFVVQSALDKQRLSIVGGFCDQLRITKSVFPRDPNPDYGHGVISIEALIRWLI